MKKTAVVMIGIAVLLAAIFMLRLSNNKAKDIYSIGILQTASHPALDAVYFSFKKELSSLLENRVQYTTYNAQGAITSAHAQAQQMHSNQQFDAFFAIATPAVQALALVEKIRPIIIAAVTDPNALGLLHATTNVCGTSDMIDVKAEVAMLTQLIPSAQKVGILYTSGESNSVTLAKLMKAELEARGLKAMDFAMSSEADVAAVAELASRKTDVLLAPTDNTVASSITLISNIARKYNKALIVSDNMLVSYGALASRGVDYQSIGQQSARIAFEVLTGTKKPYELAIEGQKDSRIFVNKERLQALGLSIPEQLDGLVTHVDPIESIKK